MRAGKVPEVKFGLNEMYKALTLAEGMAAAFRPSSIKKTTSSPTPPD
jgi:hypothetical protein